MKWWPVVILVLMLVLGAVVPGCRHVPHYDGRLTAADSLMRTNPDSALTILESLNSSPARGEVARSDGGGGAEPARGEVTRSDGGGGAEPVWGEVARSDGGGGAEPARKALTSDADLAYRDLLLTQARYKCYITATSDSDINHALAYYRAHPADREKLTRAYIYKGAVMQELGHSDSAMLYYKTAETTAAPDDYFNLGYSNLRIAELFQGLYINDNAAIARMKMATNFFTIINDTDYLITTIGTQGALIDTDSSKYYLEKAISLAKAIHSPKRFNYQSKLAGYYFYQKDYHTAKNLSMDIISNGADECDEYQFYYYAARSFIQLSCLDSAKYVFSIIPVPLTPIDSMNHYKLAAELAAAEHRYHDYALSIAQVKEINDRIITNSLDSQVEDVEILFDAKKFNHQYKTSIFNNVILILIVVLLALGLIFFWLTKRIRKRIRKYQTDIDLTRTELEQTIKVYENIIAENEVSLARQKELLEEKDKTIRKVTKENDKLLSRQSLMDGQVSRIVRNRLSAINELYHEVRVKTSNNAPYKHYLPLISLLKDLNDKKKLSMLTPKDSFWKKLKISIDDEYQGLATFVEQRYPSLTTKDFQLFLLLSAKISPQIIKLCMDYSHPITVSNYKRKLIKEIMGHDMKFEEFIQAYLDGELK